MRQFDRIKKKIKETGMLDGQERVICGLSGGADSVFLFLVLNELKAELGFHFRACHIHHGIRGAEADRDAAFVNGLAEQAGIPLRIFYRDIPREAKESGRSLEEAGRTARYECFLQMAEEWRKEDGQKARSSEIAIALAHHENDLAESVLFRLARGTGIHGLAPMRAKSLLNDRTVLLRPLLTFSRKEIEDALTERGCTWMEDSTNAEDDAVRNRIRHAVLPLLEEQVNSSAVRHIAGAAMSLTDVSDFLLAESRRRAGNYLSSCADGLFVSEKLLGEMPAMQGEIIRLAVMELTGKLKDIGSIHIRDILSLFDKEMGKELHLPYKTCAKRSVGGIVLCGRAEKNTGHTVAEVLPLHPGEGVKLKKWRIFAEFETSWEQNQAEKRYTKTIDYGKMKDTLVVRYRKKGDFLTVRSDGARKTLSDYFTDEKVPRELRDHIPLVADGSEIVWIVGMRIGYRYRITADTAHALRLTACSEDGA